jgi:hypothetical protein
MRVFKNGIIEEIEERRCYQEREGKDKPPPSVIHGHGTSFALKAKL